MELRDVLQNRRSVREYQDTPIEPQTIQSLIDAAILAPSAVNSQPWEFWIVLGRQRIDDLSDRAKAWLIEKVAHNPMPKRVINGSILPHLNFRSSTTLRHSCLLQQSHLRSRLMRIAAWPRSH
jgi:nitroreductase